VSLSVLLDMMADARPDQVALGTLEDGLTCAQLRSAAIRGSAGLRPTERRTVVYVGVNGIDFSVALWSAVLAGMSFCPLNYRLSAAQLRRLLDAVPDPLVLVGDGYESLLADCPAPTRSLTGFSTTACDHTAGVPAAPPVGDDEGSVLLFTSGTASTPKAVVLSQANLLSYVLETVDFGSAEPGDAIVVSMPPYHIAGLNAALTNPYAGRRVVYLPNFDAATWLELVRRESITHAMVVPTMLARILEFLGGALAEVPSLRTLSYGGARMPRAVLEGALAAFPSVDFVNAYGLTETSSTIALLGPADHRAAAASNDPLGRARLSSVGRPLPGIEIEVRSGAGALQPPGLTGELWVRGPQISGQYLEQGSVLDEYGWFPTRDRARVDAEGYIYVEGRADDTIIRGGENIAPTEIEEVLIAHEEIVDAAVIGRPDEEWGERILAAIVLAPGASLDADAVRDHARDRLRSSRTPDDVVFVDALPYTSTGKLIRRDLARVISRAHPARPGPSADGTASRG